jgi:hypothetical protein
MDYSAFEAVICGYTIIFIYDVVRFLFDASEMTELMISEMNRIAVII